jgi:hypothetical protein
MNGEYGGMDDQQASEKSVEVVPAEVTKSASMLPLIVLFQRAWESAQRAELSLGQLRYAAEAVALADAVAHLLADAGDDEGYQRWTIRLSEARQWCAAVHDALAGQEERDL